MENKSESRIRIKDIAHLAGVSAGTVDRVLHNRAEVSENTRKRVLEIIRKMDYQPDILASALAARKPCRIAVLIPESTAESPFWKYPNAGIEEGLFEVMHFGVSLERFYFDFHDQNSYLSQAEAMLESRPQGIIMAPVFTDESSHLLERCNELEIPVVLINANLCGGSCLAFIGQDSLQSGMVAARLMHYGLRDDADLLIVNFTREKGNQEHILKREEGFRRYYRKYCLNGDTRISQINIPEPDSLAPDKVLDKAISSSSRKIKGIFVTNSRVFRVARFLEINKARDIVLVGYDLLEENKKLLRRGCIDFLISQKPGEQGFKSIMTLYHHLVLRKEVERSQYLPIDIISRENLEHYTYT